MDSCFCERRQVWVERSASWRSRLDAAMGRMAQFQEKMDKSIPVAPTAPGPTQQVKIPELLSEVERLRSRSTFRRYAILLSLFQCFLSCFCFQVSASPTDLFAQYSVFLQRVSFFFPSLHQCQELWVPCTSRVFPAFSDVSLIFSDQVCSLCTSVVLLFLSNRPLPPSAGGFVVFLCGLLSLHLSVFLSISAMIGLWSVLL